MQSTHVDADTYATLDDKQSRLSDIDEDTVKSDIQTTLFDYEE